MIVLVKSQTHDLQVTKQIPYQLSYENKFKIDEITRYMSRIVYIVPKKVIIDRSSMSGREIRRVLDPLLHMFLHNPTLVLIAIFLLRL